MNMIGSKRITGLQELPELLPESITGSHPQRTIREETDTNEDFRWGSIISYYCIYIGIIFIGGVIGFQTTEYGAAVFLFLLYARYGRHLFKLKLDLLFYCVLFMISISLIPMMSFDQDMFLKTWRDLVKHWALLFVMLVGLRLPLTPLSRAKQTWMLQIIITVFLVVGWIWQIATGVHEPRVKGFLANPNNFALTAMMLLLLMNEKSKGLIAKGANHMIVLFMIYISQTSGALIGYAAGMMHRFVFGNGKNEAFTRGMAMFITVVAAVIILISIPANTFRPIDVAIGKIKVAWDNMKMLSSKQIEYGEIVERQGRDVTSGLWRLHYWHRLWGQFWDSSIDSIFFGYGVGTVTAMYKAKPHNDYLRLLFETGVFGLMLFIAIWAVIYRKMETQYRWVVIMIATYCISENNYDHFPAMSLLALYMLGAKKQSDHVMNPPTPI